MHCGALGAVRNSHHDTELPITARSEFLFPQCLHDSIPEKLPNSLLFYELAVTHNATEIGLD